MSGVDPTAVVEALPAIWAALADVTDGLADAQWQLDTDCPGWTVADHVAHLTGGLHLLCGRPQPEVDVPDLTHLTGPFGQWMEQAVEDRRGWSGTEVRDEFVATAAEAAGRLADDPDLVAWHETITGPLDYEMARGQLATVMVLDGFVHQRDVARALGGGGLTEHRAADLARAMLVTNQAAVLAAGLGPSSLPAVVSLTLTGPGGDSVTLIADPAGPRAVPGVDPTAHAHLTLAEDDWLRLATGRAPDTGLPPGALEIDGDETLAAEAIALFNVVP